MNDEKERLSILSERKSEYGTISATESHGYDTSGTSSDLKPSKKVAKKKQNSVSLIGMFKYGTGLDWFLIALGTFGSLLNGLARPLMAIVFGRMTDSFLEYEQSTEDLSEDVLRFPDPDHRWTANLPRLASDFRYNYSESSSLANDLESSSAYNGFYSQVMFHYAIYYAYFGLLVIFASILQYAGWQYTCERQVQTIKKKFFKQVLRQDIAWFDAHKSGEFTSKLNDDIERIRDGIGNKAGLFIQSVATFLGGFIIGFAEAWQLTLIIVFLAPFLVVTTSYKGVYMTKATIREQENYGKISAVAEEVFASVRTVLALCGQFYEIERYQRLLEEAKKMIRRKYLIFGFVIGLDFLILYSAYGLAYWYGAKLVLSGTITPGSIFIIFLAVILGSLSLGNAMPSLTDIAAAKGSAANIYEIIERQPKIDSYSTEGQVLEGPIQEIKFENINFFYPTRPSVQVLHDFSLDIQAGQSVALCGGSGSGKSTIVALLQRFYDPTSGRITVNGIDIRDLNVNWWRSQIGIVSQEAVLFSGTIRENISLGAPNASFDEIVKAAKKANAHSFIKSLPAGYDTLVGERGAQLSGGQKQRIAIARAIIGDPKLLLLDEATSALDTVNEQVVQRALDKARKGRITLIVAHRLSTIKDADCICAMEKGHLIEKGKHDELVSSKGVYYRLTTNQVFLNQEPTSEDKPDEVIVSSKARTLSASELSTSLTITSKTKIAEVEGEKVEIPSTWKILKWCRHDKLLVTLMIISASALGIVMPLFAVFFASVYESFALPKSEILSSAFFWSMMFFALAGLTFVCHFLRATTSGVAGENMTRRLRVAAYTSILRQDMAWHDEETHAPARLSTKLARDAPMIRSAAGTRIGLVLSCIVTMIAGMGIAYYFGWLLALALTAMVPLLLLAGKLEMSISKGDQVKEAEEIELAGRIATEAIENVRTVQSLTREVYFYEKYSEKLEMPINKSKKKAIIYSFSFAFTQSLVFFVYGAGFCFGAYLVSIGEMSPTNVYRVFFSMTMSAIMVGQLTSLLPDYTQAKLSAGLVFKIIEARSAIDNLSTEGLKPEIKGRISIEDVYFSYPSRQNISVLNGLSVEIEEGKTLALVGESGCGKSTIISLIMRYYNPESGSIKVDDYDIRDMNIIHLRSRIGYVGQEPVLFSGTVAYNITYGLNWTPSQEDIENVAKQANIHDFIVSLPRQYQTLVGERGMQLSGGQKQRVAIARALIRRPAILLLDEATSALDTLNEKLVQEALDRAKGGRTCIVIAHRLSTIRSADRIAVIEKGRVVEIGTHEELMNKKGAYYALTERQRFASQDDQSA